MKLIVGLAGFVNCTLKVTDWFAARLVTLGTVRYGVPERLPVALTSVTSVGIPAKNTCNGPLIEPVPTFAIVTVPLNVWLTRL